MESARRSQHGVCCFRENKNISVQFDGEAFGERKATLTEYLTENMEKLALLRFSFEEAAVAA